MKYFLGEIYVTHKKTWFGWIENYDKFSTTLIEAKDSLEARYKVNKWAEERMSQLIGKFKYEAFATPAI